MEQVMGGGGADGGLMEQVRGGADGGLLEQVRGGG